MGDEKKVESSRTGGAYTPSPQQRPPVSRYHALLLPPTACPYQYVPQRALQPSLNLPALSDTDSTTGKLSPEQENRQTLYVARAHGWHVEGSEFNPWHHECPPHTQQFWMLDRPKEQIKNLNRCTGIRERNLP